MAAPRFDKDPDAVLDYTFDWTDWLEAGDAITTATVVSDSPGLSVDSSSFTADSVTAWLSAGAAGTTYNLTCHVVTTAARQDDWTIRIKVVNK